jgi:hypothetical protein
MWKRSSRYQFFTKNIGKTSWETANITIQFDIKYKLLYNFEKIEKTGLRLT